METLLEKLHQPVLEQKADRDAAAEKLYNLVNTQLDKLGDGDYVDFEVTYNLATQIITKAEAEAVLTKLQQYNDKVLINSATDTVKVWYLIHKLIAKCCS